MEHRVCFSEQNPKQNKTLIHGVCVFKKLQWDSPLCEKSIQKKKKKEIYLQDEVCLPKPPNKQAFMEAEGFKMFEKEKRMKWWEFLKYNMGSDYGVWLPISMWVWSHEVSLNEQEEESMDIVSGSKLYEYVWKFFFQKS